MKKVHPEITGCTFILSIVCNAFADTFTVS